MFERSLIIETSGKVGQVALADEEEILATAQLPEARRHARDLALRTKELLEQLQWQARDLTSVIVNLGPGSFTGLRVGLASAKTLAYAVGCPLLGIPAFQSVAVRIPPNDQILCIIADALQGSIYEQMFKYDGARQWGQVRPLAIRPFDNWKSDLQQGWIVAGPAASVFGDRLPENVSIAPETACEPDAASLLRVAMMEPERWRVDPWTVEPLYLRGSSAEEKKKACRDAEPSERSA